MLKRLALLSFLAAPLWAADTSPIPGYNTPAAVVEPSTPTAVAAPKEHKPSRVPLFRQFVRSLEMEGGVGAATSDYTGTQFFRIETRYLDPDVNAFVGMLGSVSRFNEKLSSGENDSLSTSHFMGNWGIDIGMVRGRHLWAVDLMGGNLGSRLAFAPAFVGEHTFSPRWVLYHRTIINAYIGDPLLDSDQGLIWKPTETFGFSFGYRIVAAKHLSRNGPRVGILYRFQSPKIPFIFPSLG